MKEEDNDRQQADAATFDFGEMILETLYREGLVLIEDLLPQDLLDLCIKDVHAEFQLKNGGKDGRLVSGKDLDTRSDRVVTVNTNLKNRSGLQALYDVLANEVLEELNQAFQVKPSMLTNSRSSTLYFFQTAAERR